VVTPAPFDFAGLYRRHAPAVYRYGLFLSGSHATAEDIVAETFVRVWGARERVEVATVSAYLLAIARNVFLKGLRGQRQEAQLYQPGEELGRPPDEARESSDELRRVLAQLRTLPEADRTALLLRADEGLSYQEIARVLGITPVSARVKVHRARARLAALREGGTR
jgi:RNA polymerase sigma-70 factor (ECF subfamily)